MKQEGHEKIFRPLLDGFYRSFEWTYTVEGYELWWQVSGKLLDKSVEAMTKEDG